MTMTNHDLNIKLMGKSEQCNPCWLVENKSEQWITELGYFTNNPTDARRFKNKSDAEWFIYKAELVECIATEHEFVDFLNQ